MKLTFALVALGAVFIAVSAQDPTDQPEPTTSTTPAPSGQPYGAVCNGVLLQCRHYSETVLCLQRREATTTTEAVTGDPLIALFQKNPTPKQEVCETGLGVDLGRCQCKRNCKEGLYVEDGEFDPYREVCVGRVGSMCSLLAPNCVENAHCNLLASKCQCDSGYVEYEGHCMKP